MVNRHAALMAILYDEPERRAVIEKIEAADTRLLSAANLVEASIVVEARRWTAHARRGANGLRQDARGIPDRHQRADRRTPRGAAA